MIFFSDIPIIRITAESLFFALLFFSGILDSKWRRIPRFYSYLLLILTFLRLLYEKKYMLSAYFAFSILSTGEKKLKIPLLIAAVVVFANTGGSAAPMIFGLAAADLLFSSKAIGGGDAQLLYAMLGWGHDNWKMAAAISAVTLVSGSVIMIRKFGIPETGKRILRAAGLKAVKDADQFRIPYAVILPFSFILYLFVSFLI